MTASGTGSDIACVMLAAGKGTRMKSARPKVLHPIAGRPMIAHLLETVRALEPARLAVVVGPDMEAVSEAVAPAPTAIQRDQRGTGDAVKAALPLLEGFGGTVLVLYGDTPLLSADTLRRMAAAAADHAVVALGFRPLDSGAYGRLITAADGALEAIVEARDATPEQLEIPLCNSGVMAIDGAQLGGWLDRLSDDNAKREFYLTDIVAFARADGLSCGIVEAAAEELMGVNSRAELAVAEATVQVHLRERAMAQGATLIDPHSVFLCHDTALGRDVTIEPNVIFGRGVAVGDDVTIRAFSHLEGVTVEAGATIGPFARLRPGAVIGPGARVGNFVEVKNATFEAGAKANHLAYIGDARVGAKANVGAGTITCNYDGFEKGFTDIGEGAFIGSNSALVAPVAIGRGAIVGAGSTITRDVADDAVAVERAEQSERPGAAERFRERKAAARAGKGRSKGRTEAAGG